MPGAWIRSVQPAADNRLSMVCGFGAWSFPEAWSLKLGVWNLGNIQRAEHNEGVVGWPSACRKHQAPKTKLQRRPKLQAPIHFCGECRERGSVRSNRRLITAGAWFVDLELGVSLKIGVWSLGFGSWGTSGAPNTARERVGAR